MVNFNDISIITHVRLDELSRLDNFKTRNDYYNTRCKNLEFIHVEDDVKSKLEENNYSFGKNEKHVLYNNTGNYNKNASYNYGFNHTKRKNILFLDVDCIIDPVIIRRIVDSLDDKIVYPYATVVYLEDEATKLFKSNYNEFGAKFENYITPEHDSDKTIAGFGRVFTKSCGGAILTSKETFTKVNGFNPNFTGWGYEDSEFRERTVKLGYTPHRTATKDIMMFHLCHGQHFYARHPQANSPSYKANQHEYEKVNKKTAAECWEYIKTWKL